MLTMLFSNNGFLHCYDVNHLAILSNYFKKNLYYFKTSNYAIILKSTYAWCWSPHSPACMQIMM